MRSEHHFARIRAAVAGTAIALQSIRERDEERKLPHDATHAGNAPRDDLLRPAERVRPGPGRQRPGPGRAAGPRACGPALSVLRALPAAGRALRPPVPRQLARLRVGGRRLVRARRRRQGRRRGPSRAPLRPHRRPVRRERHPRRRGDQPGQPGIGDPSVPPPPRRRDAASGGRRRLPLHDALRAVGPDRGRGMGDGPHAADAGRADRLRVRDRAGSRVRPGRGHVLAHGAYRLGSRRADPSRRPQPGRPGSRGPATSRPPRPRATAYDAAR